MQKQVGVMASEIFALMEQRGLSPSKLTQNRRTYHGIIRWFTERNGGYYDSGVLGDFCTRYNEKYFQQKIKKQQYQQVLRMINYLQEYAETGEVTFKLNTNTRKYVPSVEAHELINSTLAETEFTEKYKYQLECNLRRFFCYLEDRELNAADISYSLLQEYLYYIFPSNSGNMDKTVQSLKVLLIYLKSERIIETSPDFSCISPRKAPKKIISPYSKDEVAKILSVIDTKIPVGKRNYAIILLACGTGLRGCDIANLKLLDINWKSGEISIIQSKTQKALKLPISGQIRNAVSDYILNGRQKSDCHNVFLRVRAPFIAISPSVCVHLIDRTCDKAGVDKKPGRSFHSLRRSFGTWLSAEEIDVTAISQMFGHVNLNSGKPYLSFNDTQMAACAMDFSDILVKGGVYL